MDFVPLLSSSRLWDLDFQMKCKIDFHLKRGLWTTEQQSQLFFSLAQVRCFWRCFCFRSGLVALFLKMSERGDSWCTDSASVHSLWSFPKCLNLLCLTVFSSLRSSLLLVHIFLPNLFLPVNFAFNMLWYSTLWTATLSVMTLWDLPSLWRVWMIVFWTIAKSAVFPIIVVSKKQEIPGIYTVWMVIYWNSNISILIFWDNDFWLSLAVSSNHENLNLLKKKLLKCFTLHVFNLKYMKVYFIKERFSKKKMNFFTI